MPDTLDLQVGNATYSGYDTDGYLSVQFDADGEGQAAVAPYWGHHPLGFIGRPLDPILDGSGQPDPTRSCVVLVGLEGGTKGHAIPLEDTRVMPLLPQLQKGESMMYGPAWGQFVRMHSDGTISLFTTTAPALDSSGNFGNGKPVQMLMSADGSIEFVTPYVRMTLGPSGFHVKHSSGARLDLGSIGGLPAPLDQVGSHFSVQAGMANLDVSVAASGPSNGVSGGATALADPLLLLLTTIGEAVVAALGSITSGAPAGGQPAASALQTALATALLAAKAAVPSQAAAA